MQDLLIELGCEDLPARYVLPLADALAQGVSGGLARRGVAIGNVRSFATPRRIAVIIAEVAPAQPTQTIERKGPQLAAAFKNGQPTPAALGFARSCGVPLEEIAQEGGQLVFRKTQPGRATVDLIGEIFEETLKAMDELVPKRMRWGGGEETFVRPVQWILGLLGSEVVPLARFGLSAGRVTYGHRFHAPAPIELTRPADYEKALQAANVWADVASRKAEIRRQVEAQAKTLGGHARISEDLLDEVTALVEWPVAISGSFEQRFLELPPEVIVATVETNQRYFTVFADAALTKLKPHFITISNIASRDAKQVVAGNERVVRPRLADAMFFWQQDLKAPLEAYGAKLATVTFQKALGTIADKVTRIMNLAVAIARSPVFDADAEPGRVAQIERAALLCKNDLVTRMVYEFPELQGLMGGYYARQAGEPETVARAIAEHYLPAQQGTPIPSTRAGQVLALADRLDTLAGIFAIGGKPGASKDPYALRRAALGALRICLEGELPLDLNEWLEAALQAQPAGKCDAAMLGELWEFVIERLRAYLVGQSIDGRPVTVEMFEAVRAMNVTQPLDFLQRLRAVHGFVALPAAVNLAAAHKRIRNILRQAGGAQGEVTVARLEHAAEKALHRQMGELQDRNARVHDYTKRMINLAALREPVDAFFDQVMVNVEDAALRANRLALLARLDAMCREVADLSCLPG